MRIRLLILSLCLLATRLWAQPVDLTRVIQTLDFEERHLGNSEDLPMNWNKVSGDGLPHYVNGLLSNDRAHSGQYSFRFDLNGGSLIYRYKPGLIPIQASAHYRVQSFVQTTALPNARARITAFFADQDGRGFTDTIVHSPLFVSPAGDTNWRALSLEITAPPRKPSLTDIDRKPTSIVVELELLQPERYAASSLGDHALYRQDVFGSAWFDDVTVSQVPQVRLSTDRPGNVFRQSDPLLVNVNVDDQVIDDLSGKLVITDATGAEVFQRNGALMLERAKNGLASERKSVLQLPTLPAGWYSAALLMTSNGRDVGRQSIDLVRLADDGQTFADDRRFGIDATALSSQGWDDLPQLLSMLSAGRVKLGVWSEQSTVNALAERFDQLLDKLRRIGIEPTACLLSLPQDVQASLRAARPQPVTWNAPLSPDPAWTLILGADASIWQSPLEYLIARHATHVQHWQLGLDGSAEFATQPKMRAVYQKVFEKFSSLIEKPDLALPWPAYYDTADAPADALALHIKPDVLPEQVPLYLKDNTAGSIATKKNISVYLEPLDRKQYGRDNQIRDLVQRTTYALTAGAQRIDLPLPFRVENEPGNVNKQPQELLLVMRTMMSVLDGATYKGKIPIAEGIDAFLFDRDGQGVIVLWDRGDSPSLKQLAINLGPTPTRVDLMGNISPLLHSTAQAESGDVMLDVGPMPQFLIGVDGELAQLRASIALDNPMLESDFKPHTRTLKFTNTCNHPLSGTIKLSPPPGWSIGPASMAFTLNAGETFQRSLEIEFPYSSFAGSKTVQAHFTVQGQTINQFNVPLTLKLGLSDIGLQSLAVRDGGDIVLQQIISNYGEKPIDYTAFGLLPGQARQERLISALPPGKTIIRKFRFKDVPAGNALKVRSGLKELDGTRMLNDEVTVR